MKANDFRRCICAACGGPIDEMLDADQMRQPCPACGATARTFLVSLAATVTVRTALAFKHKRPGQKKPVTWGFVRPETYRKTAAAVELRRRFDRGNDRYTETVTDFETGVVIHHSDEKLSDHRGHGSAKAKARK